MSSYYPYMDVLMPWLFDRVILGFLRFGAESSKEPVVASRASVKDANGPPPRLPPELLDCILSHLASSLDADYADAREAYTARRATFKTCALVHRSWTPLARRFLHEKLRLTGWLDAHLRCFTAQHLVGTRVCTLVVDLENADPRMVTLVPAVVRACPNVEVLGLLNVSMAWLEDLEKLKNLRRLHLRNTSLATHYSPSSLPSFLSVQYLSLHQSHLPYYTEATQTQLLQRLFPSLTALDLLNSTPFIASKLSHLRHLSLYDAWLHASMSRTASTGEVPSFAPPSLDTLSVTPSTLADCLDLLAASGLRHSVRRLRIERRPVERTLPLSASLAAERAGYVSLARGLREGAENPLLAAVEEVVLPALVVMDPTFRAAVRQVFEACKERGVKVVYYEAEEESEGRSRANASEFRTGFWREVE
ncbi:hypothetical protein JCM10207_007415 [Rhodosporidiobolus poonsookiae]